MNAPGKAHRPSFTSCRTTLMLFVSAGGSLWRAGLATVLCLQLIQLGVPRSAHGQTASTRNGSTLRVDRGGTGVRQPGRGIELPTTNPFTGNASFQYPIDVPEAAGDVEPALGLSYSSSRANVRSWVGSGWSLDAGEITRSLKNGVPKYDDSDTLQLDGVDLIRDPSDANNFFLRSEAFLRIRRSGEGFEVQSKDGTRKRFGISTESRLTRCEDNDCTAPPGPNDVFAWLLAEVEDRNGNIALYSYDHGRPTDDLGYAVLKSIRYSLRRNPLGGLQSAGGQPVPDPAETTDRVVEFKLEPRSSTGPRNPSEPLQDSVFEASTGFMRLLVQRLAAIDVRAGGKLLRRYRLSYTRSFDSSTSMLASVEQFGADADFATPHAPLVTRFEYQSNAGLMPGQAFGATDPQNTAQKADSWRLPAGLNFVRADFRDLGTRLVDLDGDGRVDVIRESKLNLADENEATSNAYLNSATGFITTPNADYRLPRDPANKRYAFVEGATPNNLQPTGTLLIDMTGDGRADVLHLKSFRDLQTRNGGLFIDYRWDHDYLVRTDTGFTRVQQSAGSQLDIGNDDAAFAKAGIISPFVNLAMQVDNQTTGGSIIFEGNTQITELNGDGLPDLLERGLLITQRPRSDSNLPFVMSFLDSNYGLNLGGMAGFDRAPLGGTRSRQLQSNNAFLTGENERNDRYAVCDLQQSTATDHAAFESAPLVFEECFFFKYFGFTDSAVQSDQVLGTRLQALEELGLGKAQVDLNSDGLDDTLLSYSEGTPNSQFSTVLFNAGKVATSPKLAPGQGQLPGDRGDYFWVDLETPAPLQFRTGQFSSRDLGARLADINGDGRIDFVIASPTVRQTFLGTGAAKPKLFIDAPEWAVPAGFEFVNADGADMGVRLIDLNGDRLPDLIRAIEGTPPQVMLNQGVLPDLLSRVVNPLGGTTTFQYGLSTDFPNNGGDAFPDLADVFPVVTSIVNDPGNGQPAIGQAYLYANGLRDNVRREFRGFGTVAILDATLRRTVMVFHQDEARQGLPMVIEKQDTDATLLSRTENTFPADATPPFLSLLQRTDTLEYDRAATPRRSRSTFSYDALGNLVSTTDFGEVDAQAADLDPSDTLTTERDFFAAPAATAPYLNALPREVRERQGVAGAVLRRTRLFYDGDTTGTALPTRGNLTMHVAVLGESGKPDPTTRFTYNAFGNAVTVTSARASAGQVPANEGVVRVEYDSSGAFVTARQQVVAGVTQREELDYTFASDCASIVSASPFPAAAGLAHLVRDVNAAGDPDPRHATLLCYDVFGRAIARRAPDGLSSSLTAYNDTPGAISTLTLTRAVDNPSVQGLFAGLRLSTTTFDGLGRVLQTSAPGSRDRAIVQRNEYDALGRVSLVTDPRFDSEAERVTRFTYDGLDRLATRTEPSTTAQPRRTSFSYDRGTTTTTDPNGLPTVQKADPFGRIRELIEADGSATDRTRYSYDPAGRLTRITDRGGNVTQIAYDGLGRQRSLTDPDTSVTTFAYDAADNVLTQTNAAGSVTATFDSLNRLLTKTRSGDANVDRFVYDSAPRGIGRLARRTDGTGSVEVLDYDRLGRVVKERFRIANATLDFTNTYDPLGQVIARRYPSGRVVARERDGRGFTTGVVHTGGRYASDVEFDAQGRLSSYRSGNGVTTRRSFDPATGRLATIEVRNSGQTVLEALQYGYDAGDRVTGLGTTSGPFTFGYDTLDRLTQATGPYATGLVPATLRYAYDRLGNMTCKDAGNVTNCAGTGGTSFAYPAPGATTVRPHAATSVNNVAAMYTATGHLQTLGARRYDYDVAGQLTSASQNGAVVSRFLFNAEGNLTTKTELNGTTATSVRHLIARDFEWNQTTSKASIHVFIDGERIATQTDSFAPATSGTTTTGPTTAGSGAIGSEPDATGDHTPRGPMLPAGLPLAAMFALWLALLALWRARHPRELARVRTVTAATLAFVLVFGPALVHAAPSGNLNGDARLDSADALRLQRMIDGTLPADLARGDVAPLSGGDGRIAENDLLLLLRATRGEDVDRDGLLPDAELAAGASPFSADSDGDGLNDAQEIAARTNPNVRDTDGDGVLDGLEVTLGRDPLRADPADPGAANVVYYHTDQLGSSVLTTNSTGAVIDKLVYRPYGSTVPRSTGPAIPPEFGFTGQRFISQLGIYDYGARFYDPALGRFLQADSIVQAPYDPQTLNRYSYVQNNPINRIDPTGNASFAPTPQGGTSTGMLCFVSGPGCNKITIRPAGLPMIPTGPQVLTLRGSLSNPILDGAKALGGAILSGIESGLASLVDWFKKDPFEEDFPDNTFPSGDAQVKELVGKALYEKNLDPETIAASTFDQIREAVAIVSGVVVSREQTVADLAAQRDKTSTSIDVATDLKVGGEGKLKVPGGEGEISIPESGTSAKSNRSSEREGPPTDELRVPRAKVREAQGVLRTLQNALVIEKPRLSDTTR